MGSYSPQGYLIPSHSTIPHSQSDAPNPPSEGQPHAASLLPTSSQQIAIHQPARPNEDSYRPLHTESALDWILKILGVAAAITFGIWAPLSWKATADGNEDNNTTQNELGRKLDALSKLDALGKLDALSKLDALDQISDLRDQAINAATYQTSAADALDELRDKTNALGVLRLYEFCEGRTNIKACEWFMDGIDIDRYITSLAPYLPSLEPTPTSRPESSRLFPTTSRSRTFGISSTQDIMSSQDPSLTTDDFTFTRTAGPGGTSRTSGPGGTSPPDGGPRSGTSQGDLVEVILGSVFGGIALIGAIIAIVVSFRRYKKMKQTVA